MSSSTLTPVGTHAIIDAVTQLGAVLDAVTAAPAWSLTPKEQTGVIVDLARVRAGVDELWLRVLAAADRSDVAARSAATSTTAWLAHATVRPPGAAHADLRLAAALDDSCGATRVALAAGVIDVDRARVIVRALETLPTMPCRLSPGSRPGLRRTCWTWRRPTTRRSSPGWVGT